MRKNPPVVEENVLRVGTLNLSIAAVKQRPERLVAEIKEAMNKVDILLIQEAGAAKNLLARIVRTFRAEDDDLLLSLLRHVENDTVSLYAGSGLIGQASDPILYRSSLDVRGTKSYPLTGRLYQGKKGAGAREWTKPKFMNTLQIRFKGRKITAGNIHATPSQYLPLRFAIASKQFNASAAALAAMTGLRLIGGDMNAVPGKRQLDVYLKAGLLSAQAELGPVGTHGSRAIDDVYYLDSPSRWRLVDLEVIDTVSDHDLVVVSLEVFPR